MKTNTLTNIAVSGSTSAHQGYNYVKLCCQTRIYLDGRSGYIIATTLTRYGERK